MHSYWAILLCEFAKSKIASQTYEKLGLQRHWLLLPPDIYEAKTAAAVFDTLDEAKEGKVPAAMLEALTDELGEGFQGDEFDKQLAIIDPEGTSFIDRSSFEAWYPQLGLGGSGDGERWCRCWIDLCACVTGCLVTSPTQWRPK